MTWPTGRAPTGAEDSTQPEGRAATGTYPVPQGRGRWRLTLHNRLFALGPSWPSTLIAELTDATSRSLEQNWNAPAQLTFAIDGHSPAAALIAELQTDVVAWRWDDQEGVDQSVFHGPVTQSQDTISEQTHTVTFTCHDYSAMLQRRFTSTLLTYVQDSQDEIVQRLLNLSSNVVAANGTSLAPGSWLTFGAGISPRNPDGTSRPYAQAPVPLRDRTYAAGSNVGQLISDLATVINGFDYDVQPTGGGFTAASNFRVFYPYQGIQRTTPALVYGSTVSSLTRSVNSADYSNFWRVIGQAPAGSADGTPPMYSEQWNSDANNVGVIPIGLWQNVDNQSDVSIQSTLDDTALGDLSQSGVLIPTYSLALRPGAYSWGNPNMGDVVPLIVQSGRLNVNTNVRVLGITYAIGDDGQEDVTLTVGRPDTNFPDLLRGPVRDVDALARR